MAKLTLKYNGKAQQSFFLTEGEMLIGAHPDCDICIANASLREEYARVTLDRGRYHISAIDGNERIQVNHIRVHAHPLDDGDVIHLGPCLLVYSDETAGSHAYHASARPQNAWLQILNGTHQGRTIHLTNPVTRFGIAGTQTVMISRRDDGYYLSQLEGDRFPQVNQAGIGDGTCPLNNGDIITLGELEFGFFLEDQSPAGAESRHPPAASQPQRRFTRVSLQTPAIIASGDKEWSTRLVDLSLGGALLEQPAGWEGSIGDRCILKLQLADKSYIGISASLRRIEKQRLGVAFHQLNDTARKEIRWLVELNMGDADLLEKEFSQLA